MGLTTIRKDIGDTGEQEGGHVQNHDRLTSGPQRRTGLWHMFRSFRHHLNIYEVDGFSEFVGSLLCLILLLVFFFALFPRFSEVETELEWSTKLGLARHRDNQWTMCPEGMGQTSQGIMKNASSILQDLRLNCTFAKRNSSGTGAATPIHLEVPLERRALVILGMVSYFQQPSNRSTFNWCYMKEDMVWAYGNRSTVRALVIGKDGRMSASYPHSCLSIAPQMNPKRWRLPSKLTNEEERVNYKANNVLQWSDTLDLRDSIVFRAQPDLGGRAAQGYDRFTGWAMALRFGRLQDSKRYDYEVMLDPAPAEDGQNDPLPRKWTEVSNAMQQSFVTGSEWGYAYKAFVDALTPNETLMRECLLNPASNIRIANMMDWADPTVYRCSHDVDVEMWPSWTGANDVERALYRKTSFWVGGTSMDYDTYQAIWTGLVGAVLNSIFVSIGLVLYFSWSVWRHVRQRERQLAEDTAEHLVSPKADPGDAMLEGCEAGVLPAPRDAPCDTRVRPSPGSRAAQHAKCGTLSGFPPVP
eukprot:jgi/Botrbrau1/21315/Bobra.0184s0026.1